MVKKGQFFGHFTFSFKKSAFSHSFLTQFLTKFNHKTSNVPQITQGQFKIAKIQMIIHLLTELQSKMEKHILSVKKSFP